ncbi:protein EMBRYO DEFECTIVE 514 [Argentina anserina]|uniref:protein EMBRYO DEFECTIVE 514 n=1 Tax=Argentina anserina TaxID=57926 RepID=UPI00217693B2|nr:protein EMBRYO DEFECTIVE 514 [Potentilla anserina]
MAETTVAEIADTNPAAEDMDLETVPAQNSDEAQNGDANSKRAREEEEVGGEAKKAKVEEKSAEEQRLEKLGEGESGAGRVTLGPKSFGSAVEMFDYFYKLLHYWPTDLNINKYEYLVLLELLKKGHSEPDKKIGGGIQAFQVRFHPLYRSRCYFLIREDGASDDFSFRKCVDHILPLPENMKAHADANKALGGGKGGGRGSWRGRGRGRGRS